jgi:hypothetical protein
VICHLDCPVTDYISKFSKGGEIFLPKMFQRFPEIKEALISNRIQAAFVGEPLAIALKAQGVPIKVVYLGHRYGSAVVVQENGPIKTFADMRSRSSPYRAAFRRTADSVSPLHRVMYNPLAPRKADFDMVRDLMIETGVLNTKIEFEEYVDLRFSDHASIKMAWEHEPGSSEAK